MPRSVPNYLTIDPNTGAVGAVFTGKIAAKGVLLDESLVGVNPNAPIMWHDPALAIPARNYGNSKGNMYTQDLGSGPHVNIERGLSQLSLGDTTLTGLLNGDTSFTIYNRNPVGDSSHSDFVANQDPYLTLVADTGYVGGATFLPAGGGFIAGPVTYTPPFKTGRSGGTSLLLMTMTGYMQDNGVNGASYMEQLALYFDGNNYYFDQTTVATNGAQWMASGALVVPATPIAHTFAMYGYCTASPAIGLYGWRWTVALL